METPIYDIEKEVDKELKKDSSFYWLV